MGISRLTTAACFLFSATALAQTPQNIVYLAQQGDIEQAYTQYIQGGCQDFSVLQKVALSTIHHGATSRDSETRLLSLYGAGISLNEKCLSDLSDALTSENPQLQVPAMHFLAQFQDDRADASIEKALGSNYLLVRLEAAHILAQKRHGDAVFHIESLMYKVDPKLLPLFPQLFAAQGSPEALTVLKRQLFDKDPNVQVAAILAAARAGHDSLLPHIRTLASQFQLRAQEAAAYALGLMGDSASIPRLKQLTRSSSPTVQLAALKSLYLLGVDESASQIESLAQDGDPYAVAALNNVPTAKETLQTLLDHSDSKVRLNAALSLLELKDRRCLQRLKEILIKDRRDLALQPMTSPGGALTAWKLVPSAEQNFKESPFNYELSQRERENLVIKASLLPERNFIELACTLFDHSQHDLVPTLVALLQKQNTPNAIATLKKYQMQLGAPFIRHFCNLGLYRLNIDGPYAENLKRWVASQQDAELIRFRPTLPWDVSKSDSPHQLTPHETSRLLVESFEALAQARDEKSLAILLSAMQNGNEKNKYALAGLLLRALQ